jgi:hypothetical protein
MVVIPVVSSPVCLCVFLIITPLVTAFLIDRFVSVFASDIRFLHSPGLLLLKSFTCS